MGQKKKYIRASEIGTYIYCERSWWLQNVQGEQSQNVRALEHGTAFHEDHGRAVAFASTARRIAYGLIVICLLIVAYWLFLGG